MSEDTQFDGLYREILQRGKGIDNLFNSLFSFFSRNSDFFEQPEQGFAVIESSFKKEKEKFQLKKEKERKKAETAKMEEEKRKKEEKQSGVKEITKEEFERKKRDEEEKKQVVETKPETKSELITESKPEITSEKKEEEEDSDTKRIREKVTKMDEELRKELLKKTSHLDDKNGGKCKNYTWVQTQIEQFEMFIPIDQSAKGSEIKVTYDSKHLKVIVKGETLVDGELFAPINGETFFWTVDSNKHGKYISITFEKINRMQWWDYVIKGDDILSLSKINPEASKLSDCDPSIRPEIEKMMIENSMKLQGKPFHKDPKTNDALQKFMKDHPEMDFSKAKFS